MKHLRLIIFCSVIFSLSLGLLLRLERLANADGSGRFLIPMMPSSAPAITVDGDPADWPSTAKLCSTMTGACDLTPIGMGPGGKIRLMLKDSDDPMVQDELYVWIQVDDTGNEGAADTVTLMFDLSHDHAVASTASFDASDDRGILFTRDNTVSGRVFGNLNAPNGDPMPPADLGTRKTVASGASSWTVEAKLFPSDLGLNHFNALMGVALVAVDNNSGTPRKGKWPSAVILTDPASWANLITRLPIDYALLIDQSGSMSGVKWDSVRRAGDNFAVVSSKLKDDALDTEFASLPVPTSGDRLGLANFTWNVGPADSTIVSGLSSIPNPPPMTGYATSVLPMSPGGWTPIAEGINKTVQMFTGGVVMNPEATMAASPRTRVVMLLTDGIHNRPNPSITYTLQSSGGDFTYVPAGCAANSLVRVNTVAIGSATDTAPLTLDTIKNCFSGKAFLTPDGMATNYYNTMPSGGFTEGQLTAQLTRFFIETVTPYYHWNFIANTSGAVPTFTLKAGERKLLLLAFWDTKASAVPLSITTPSGVQMGTADTNLGISTLVINNPPAGDYSSFTAAGASRKMVLIDLRTEALFDVDNKPHGTSSTITLLSKIRDDGRPVTNADVRVDISRPEEAFGTYVSTHDPSNCSVVGPPQLPTIGTVVQLVRRDPVSTVSNRGFIVAPGGVLASTSGGPDVKPPHIQRLDQLFQQCNKTDLIQTEDPGLKLFDDATNGDRVANDGVYTLTFENTKIEGNYVFRFRANGATREGIPFTRVREVGQYVRLDVDPDSSEINFRLLQQNGKIITREYYVTPRDRFGGYLGPGHGDIVTFNTTAGTFLSPVIDYNNGIYSRVLEFNSATENPVVTGTVGGNPLNPVGGFGGHGFEFFPNIGATFYESPLNLNTGFFAGARFGYRFPNQVALEAEGGVTFTRVNAGPFNGRRAKMIQVLGNVRYDLDQWSSGNWTPYVIGGAGGIFSRGFGSNDSAFAVHGGAGGTYRITNRVGLRFDGRVFRYGSLNGAPATTNFQINGGVVFRF